MTAIAEVTALSEKMRELESAIRELKSRLNSAAVVSWGDAKEDVLRNINCALDRAEDARFRLREASRYLNS